MTAAPPLTAESPTRRLLLAAAGSAAVPLRAAAAASSASTGAASYRRIDVPVLLIWGDRDTVTPLAPGRHLASLLPRVQFELLEGISHIPQLEDEAAFNTLLLKFLGRLPQRSQCCPAGRHAAGGASRESAAAGSGDGPGVDN